MCDLFQGSVHHALIKCLITHMLRTSHVKKPIKIFEFQFWIFARLPLSKYRCLGQGSLICHPWCSPLCLAMARPARNSIARWFWICETNPREMILILQAWWIWFDVVQTDIIGKHERSVSMLAHSCSTRAEVKGKCTKTTWWRIRLCKGVRCAEFNQHQTEEANVSSEAKTPCLLLCNSDSSELVCAFWFPCRGYRMPMPRLRFMISLI